MAKADKDGRSPVVREYVWVTSRDVIDAMGSLPLTTGDRDWLATCVRATNAMIHHFRPELPCPERLGPFSDQFTDQFDDQTGYAVDPMIRYGAIQLCIEMYRRRGTYATEGVAGFGEFGPPPSSLSFEAQMFLGLGRHYRPVVA
jgi:hypothetical protein